MPVGGQDAGVVAHEHDHQDESHQRGGEPEWFDAQAGDQAKGQGREVVGHLVLGQLGGAEPDDGQDPEEAQSQAKPGGGAGQRGGDSQNANVHPQVGHHQVAAPVPVPAQVQDEREDADGRQVCGYEMSDVMEFSGILLVGCALRSTARLCRCCDGT